MEKVLLEMSNDLLISIIIIGYNAESYLSDCLGSIYNQTYRSFEVIFVNNGSNDNTALALKAYPGIRVVHNNINKGFCFANNQGIKLARGRYLLILNSDVVLDKNFLSEMKNSISMNNTGLFGAKILTGDGKYIDSAGLELSRFYRFFDRGNGERDNGQYDRKLDIFGPCAAAALYKKEMLEDIKYKEEYFDEDFFFLGEDFDLAWRAKRKGWKARFVPKAVCYHARNSTNFNNRFRQYLSFRNRYFLLIKNLDMKIEYIFVFLLYDIPRLLGMLLTNRHTCRALYETIKLAPRMRRKGAI